MLMKDVFFLYFFFALEFNCVCTLPKNDQNIIRPAIHHLLFYKNTIYRNVKAEIFEILGINPWLRF